MIYLGADHAGFELKEIIKRHLSKQKIDFHDLGAPQIDPNDDYPDYAVVVAQKVVENPENRGILICGSGQGICIAANKFKGVRAALAWDTRSARLARNDDDANVLCLAGRLTDEKTAIEMVEIFLQTKFDEAKRRVRRINKIKSYEK